MSALVGWRAGGTPSGGARGSLRGDDEALIRACRGGDQRAWDALVRRYRRLIYSIAIAFRMQPDRADDVFQRVAVKLFENLDNLRKVDRLASWLSVTTRRECLALIRSEGRYREIGDLDLDARGGTPWEVEEAMAAVEREHALALAFERLREPCRSLLAALYVEQPSPSYEEIGRRLGRPVGSLGPTRARCLGKLRKLYLEEDGPDLQLSRHVSVGSSAHLSRRSR